MLDVSLVRLLLGVAVITSITLIAWRALAAQAARSQATLLAEIRELVRLKHMEIEIELLRSDSAAETHTAPTAHDDPARAAQRTIAVIVEEILAMPYTRHHIRHDLPPDVDRVRLDTPNGPIIVTGPARHRAHGRRRSGGGFYGLVTLPIVLAGVLVRGGSTQAAASGTSAAAAATATAATVAVISLGSIAVLPGHSAYTPGQPTTSHIAAPAAEPPTTPAAAESPATPTPSTTPTPTASPSSTPSPSTTPTPTPTGPPADTEAEDSGPAPTPSPTIEVSARPSTSPSEACHGRADGHRPRPHAMARNGYRHRPCRAG